MTLKAAIAKRIRDLCKEQGITPSRLAYNCGLDRSTIYSILGDRSKSPEVATIKKICDGFEKEKVTLGFFFSTPEFDNLEQEIK